MSGDAAPRILVVDDEPRMGKAMERLLSHHYRVTVVSSAREALEALPGDPRFEAILCDLMMPEMNGMDLHDTLARTDPAMASRMVFMTGGAYTDRAQEFLERMPARRLDKPFRPDDLERMLAGVLGR
jgi:two-component system NtrC family sensor kinase